MEAKDTETSTARRPMVSCAGSGETAFFSVDLFCWFRLLSAAVQDSVGGAAQNFILVVIACTICWGFVVHVLLVERRYKSK